MQCQYYVELNGYEGECLLFFFNKSLLSAEYLNVLLFLYDWKSNNACSKINPCTVQLK